MVPIALIPQLIFAGSIVAFNKMNAISKAIAYVSASKWSFELLGTIFDLNYLFDQHVMPFLKEDYETVFNVDIQTHWGILLAFVLVFLVATYVVQRRKDVL